jgi:hypothetical protein
LERNVLLQESVETAPGGGHPAGNGFDVVGDEVHRLLQCPGAATGPGRVVDVELLKLRTTKTTLELLAAMFGLVLLSVTLHALGLPASAP